MQGVAKTVRALVDSSSFEAAAAIIEASTLAERDWGIVELLAGFLRALKMPHSNALEVVRRRLGRRQFRRHLEKQPIAKRAHFRAVRPIGRPTSPLTLLTARLREAGCTPAEAVALLAALDIEREGASRDVARQRAFERARRTSLRRQ